MSKSSTCWIALQQNGKRAMVRLSREFAKVANNSDTPLLRCCSDQTQSPGEKVRIDPGTGKGHRGGTRDPSSRSLSQQTGLPIDFEFQRSSVANKKFEAEQTEPRAPTRWVMRGPVHPARFRKQFVQVVSPHGRVFTAAIPVHLGPRQHRHAT